MAEDEILTHVVLPPLPARSGIEYIRFSSSSVVDKPCAGVAVRLTVNSDATIQTARIVLGCVGATPVRARNAEALINGKKLTPQLAEEAGSLASQECSPTSDLRGSEHYKRAIVKTLVKRAAVKAYENAPGLQMTVVRSARICLQKEYENDHTIRKTHGHVYYLWLSLDLPLSRRGAASTAKTIKDWLARNPSRLRGFLDRVVPARVP